MIPSVEERKQRNIDFWEGNHQERPLSVMRLGEVFFSREFEAAKPYLVKGTKMSPDMIDVKAYLPDYERMYQDLQQVDMDGFFSADPMTGIPWMEGSFGADIYGTPQSFVSHKVLDDVEQLTDLTFDPENPWTKKYFEFCEEIAKAGEGRYTSGEPIMRGVTDTIGSLIGQQELIWAMMEEHEIMEKAFDTVVNAQRYIIDEMYKRVKPLHGGYSCGFYHLWAPGKIMWYQEDLAALLGPAQYGEYLFKTSNEYVEGYDYSLVHLHPASFFNLDQMLKVENLKCIQINKDVGGPTVREMVPQFKKVLDAGKRLVIGMAKLNFDDIDAVYECLPADSIALCMLADDIKEANEIMDHVNMRARQRKCGI